MFDSSQEQIVQDDVPDVRHELRAKLEGVEVEMEKVRAELEASNRDLKLKNREINLLKRKITLLTQQDKDLSRYKNISKNLEISIKDKEIQIENIKKDFEMKNVEREREMREYIENNKTLLSKLKDAQDTTGH
jgi:chromosome segregation ATPase